MTNDSTTNTRQVEAKGGQRPWVTYALLFATALMFTQMARMSDAQLSDFIAKFAVVPLRITHPMRAVELGFHTGAYIEILAYMLMHGGWLHLAFNLWSLWVVGPVAERRFGHGAFLSLYVMSGFFAGLTYLTVRPDTLTPMMGASGALAGVIGALLVMSPRRRVDVIVPTASWLPARSVALPVFAFGWFVAEIVQGLHSVLGIGAINHVPWWVHLGGFAFGAAFALLVSLKNRVAGPSKAGDPS